ncbi:peptidase [Pelistega indica]|uniref:Probable periplasmic serine endoprotease DegP-like n=1 Tax=Pelistega indica TaxID=1414851 RepID=V8G8N5_9BURK|nr:MULTISPECIES: DegQ family serine endoprotease [Pelistega]ETD72899.1 peptidase [Pelistega indica]
MFTLKKLSASLLALSLAISSSAIAENNISSVSNTVPTSQTAPLVMGLPDFTPVVQATENGVVNIRTMSKVSSQSGMGDFDGSNPEDLFRFFFGPDFPLQTPKRNTPKPSNPNSERIEPSGVGSGFIISEDGYIITNDHVVDDATKVIVTLNDGKEYTAKVIGSDKRTDIALLKIDAKALSALAMGDSEKLKKGQWVVAIGSPYGLESTVTSGIVSAINRDTGDYLPFIQTDVAINPGNSGGPLIDLAGKVVGVNSQIYTRSGGFMGISFSIPINEAMKIVEQLKSTGTVQRGRIGVMIGEVKKEVADALGLKDTKGALVSNVEPGSPAEKAGIKSGDVIVSFAGKTINKWNDLPRLVGMTKPGTQSDITVWRRGKEITVPVTLDQTAADKKVTATGENNADNASQFDKLGLSVTELTDAQKQKFRVNNGVVVNDVEGLAQDVGLRKDDIILAINDKDIMSVKQFQNEVKQLPANKAAALLIRREDLTQWVTVTPKK